MTLTAAATPETKSFDIRVLGSITSGVLLLQGFSEVHEAIEWLSGFPVWTHELPEASSALAAGLIGRFPDLPTHDDNIDDWRERADRLLAKYPEKIAFPKGAGKRARDPISILQDKVGDKPIVVITP